MQLPTGLAAATFALAAAALFGTADFCGGVAAKRCHVFGVITVARLCGLVITVALALITREAPPSWQAPRVACAVGASGPAAGRPAQRRHAVGQHGSRSPVALVPRL